MKHDLYKQITYLQEALSHNKKPIGIFLGAGCPLSVRTNQRCIIDDKEVHDDPIIPDVAGLTEEIIEQYEAKSSKDPSKLSRLLEVMNADGVEDPNIEDILSKVRALKQVVGSGKARGFELNDLKELDKEICEFISVVVNEELPSEDSSYHNLSIWIRSTEREKPVHLFTTNYDLLLEQALEETACPYFDGFIGSKNAFFDIRTVEEEQLLHPRWARLWKIHGSINWKRNRSGDVIRSDRISENENYLIYPSHLKYDQSRKMPYLAMLDRLKNFLMTHSSTLFITGYSFSDVHINDVLIQGLQSNPTAMVFALLYGELDDPKYKKAKSYASKVPNLSLLGFDKAVIGRQEGSWFLRDDEILKDITSSIVSIENSEEEKNYNLNLGDFGVFGEFLKDLSTRKKDIGDERKKE